MKAKPQGRFNWNRGIGIYEMLGGVLGFLLTVYILFTKLPGMMGEVPEAGLKLFLVVISVFALAGYGLTFFAGWSLWKGMKRGIPLSLAAQAIQIPQFSLGGLSYLFMAGLQLSVFMGEEGMSFATYLGSRWNIYISFEGYVTGVGFNLVAIAIFIYLYRQFKKA